MVSSVNDADDKAGPPIAPADVSLTIDSRRTILVIFSVCLGAELAFVLLDATVNYSRWTDYGMIRRLFNITREDGWASWFGVTQNFMVAVTVWWIWVLTRRIPGSAKPARGWMTLAILITYMAIDDGAKIHERLGSVYEKAAGGEGPGSGLLGLFPSYPWQILFVPVFGAIGIFMLVFLTRQLRSRLSIALVFAGLGLFAVATGIDFIEGLDQDHKLNIYGYLDRTNDWDEFTRKQFHNNPYETMRHFGKSVEEFMEMFGMTLIWVALLRHLGDRFRRIEIEVATEGTSRCS